MPQLAKELLDAKVDVIVAISAPATQAVRSFTTIPVIASDLETDPRRQRSCRKLRPSRR